MEIQILNVEAQSDPRSPAIARFDVVVPWYGEDFKLPGFTYFVKGENSWVGGSTRKYEKDGETRYLPWGGFCDDAVQRRFLTQIRTAFKKYLEKNPSMEPEPVLKAEMDEEIPF